MNTSITDGILYQYLRGELDAKESDRLTRQLESDADLKEQLDSLQRVYALAEPSVHETWDTSSAWDKIDAATSDAPVIELKPRTSQFSILRIAASFAVLLVSASAIWFAIQSGAGYDHQYVAQEANDKHELPDGTVVWLDQGAQISYDDSGRKVGLEGTAYFDVMRDERAPFNLELESGIVEVLGTEFNVQQQDSKVRVSVTEGKVRFSAGEDERILEVGQMAELNTNNLQLGERNELNQRDLLWHNQMWSYDQAQLSQVISDINEVFHSDIRIVKKELQNCSFSTSGTEAGLTEWLEIFSRIYNLLFY